MNFNEVTRLAQKAWDSTKPASDPVWNECNAQHRQMFLASAEAVINTGHAVNDFEHAVLRLARAQEEKQSVIEEVQAEGSGLHSDEIQLEAAKRQGLIAPERNAELPRAFAASASVEAVSEPQAVAAEPAKPKRSHKAKPKDDEAKSSKASKKSSKKGKK